MIEEWLPMPGYEDEYQISSFGRIRNLAGRHRKLYLQRDGYVTIALKRSSIRVHKLVATAFIRAGKPGEQVNHIDLNKSNNCVDNLEWCSPKENVAHAISHNRGGGKYLLTEPQVLQIRKRYAGGEGSGSIACDFGLTRGYVTTLCRGLYYQDFGGPLTARGSGNSPRILREATHAAP